MNTRIRLLKEWENDGEKFAPGIYEVDEDTAKELIAKGQAEEIKEGETEEKGDTGDKPITAEDVQAIVNTVLKANEPEPVRKLPKVTVGKELIEDDPNCGYPSFAKMGFGHFLHDVWLATSAVKTGSVSRIPKRLIKANQIMTKAGDGANEEIDPEGGYLVPVEQRAELLKKAHDVGRVFPRARPVPMSSHTLTIPYIVETTRVDGSRHGGVEGKWTGEGADIAASQPAFALLTLTANKLACLGYVTEELEADASVGALQLMGDLFAEEIAFKLDDAFINGNGAAQPLGILNAAALISTTRQTALQVNTEDIVNMFSRMFARARPNAVWFINQDIEPHLFTMTLDSGAGSTPVYMPPGGISGAPYGTLLGRPVVPIEQCATLGTLGDILFVDMTQYLYGQRQGIETAQSLHVKFISDQLAIKARLRADGQPWWDSALTPFKGTSTVSPFVGLAA